MLQGAGVQCEMLFLIMSTVNKVVYCSVSRTHVLHADSIQDSQIKDNVFAA